MSYLSTKPALSGLDIVMPWQKPQCAAPAGQMTTQQTQALVLCKETEAYNRRTGWIVLGLLGAFAAVGVFKYGRQ